MNGYQPEKTCENCCAFYVCTKRRKKHLKTCDEHSAIPPMPPNTGSSVQKPYANGGVVPNGEQYIIKHIYCDISKDFLQEYKAEIVDDITERLKNFFRDNEEIKTAIEQTIEKITRGIKK